MPELIDCPQLLIWMDFHVPRQIRYTQMFYVNNYLFHSPTTLYEAWKWCMCECGVLWSVIGDLKKEWFCCYKKFWRCYKIFHLLLIWLLIGLCDRKMFCLSMLWRIGNTAWISKSVLDYTYIILYPGIFWNVNPGYSNACEPVWNFRRVRHIMCTMLWRVSNKVNGTWRESNSWYKAS